MESVTLIIAVLACGFVLVSTPIYGILTYIAVLAWYPSYLTIPMGTVDFTASRIVILVLLVKLLFLSDLPKQFGFIWLDKIILIYPVIELMSGFITTTSPLLLIENRAGAAFGDVRPDALGPATSQNRSAPKSARQRSIVAIGKHAIGKQALGHILERVSKG